MATTDSGSQIIVRDPDVRLMLRVKDGDNAAFEELVRNYQDRLVNVFYHLLGSVENAEDLAQDVFLRIYRARHGYEPTAKFSTWLFRIANNLASNTRRSKSRRREVDLHGTADSGSRPEEELLTEKSALMPTRQSDRRELSEVVNQALSSLNERQRMAVLLHKFEDMSYADIGAAMELTEQAVKSLLSRARENLRAKLEAYVTHGELPNDAVSAQSPSPTTRDDG